MYPRQMYPRQMLPPRCRCNMCLAIMCIVLDLPIDRAFSFYALNRQTGRHVFCSASLSMAADDRSSLVEKVS